MTAGGARLLAIGLFPLGGLAAENVYLTDVPDYAWHFGCFGTATGNLMGYWDRHGLPDFYTGPTADGVAPLNSFGSNRGIRSLWASESGFDGRPADRPGHIDDYWRAYESVAEDPYHAAGREEHPPDCTGDFIGLSQKKWADLGGECAGNIDGYAFNFFESTGERRVNHTPATAAGMPIPDIQSGLRAWTEFRGAAAETFSQLSDVNPEVAQGKGFSFADLKAEIDAGYPVLLFMQPYDQLSRRLGGQSGQNPQIHALLAYGYVIDDTGAGYVRYRTSWASGDTQFNVWTSDNWTPNGELNLPLRGVIGYHPLPRLVEVTRDAGSVRLRWHGPMSVLRDELYESERPVHYYVVERTTSLLDPDWQVVAGPEASLEATLSDCCEGEVFFRVKLLPPGTIE
jgi:hypothetical protein